LAPNHIGHFQTISIGSTTAPGHAGNWNTFDVSADGQRFLTPRPEGTSATGAVANTPITVVVNWTAALNKK
jgi:hypothetical protein